MLSKTQNKSLWNTFRQGDRTAFQRIYELHARELVSYGYRITSNVQLIEDSLHDLFIELWQSRENLSETDSIRFYLFRSLRNKIQRAQQQDVFHRATDVAQMHHLEGEDEIIETQWIKTEGEEQLLRQLKAGYAHLSPRQQQAIDLRFTHHFSNEEIARIMGINYQSACKFIYSALKVLRENIRILSLYAALFLRDFL
ncbi:RNA polymerase sigma factor [Salmonirosea aquatica]|uniref:Sigma-70 family RNA polymerase sigma factor n=1 Tax=Salmonirosea aquatica TaxID=2654236 RepID=A0A7C9BM15_9BACT|nr:sigma-70 family RNA polymerase sigma factor [Cytophagaceae bacterium SJW1-29]